MNSPASAQDICWHAPIAGFQAKQQALEQAALRVLRSGSYILGEEVAAFEQEFLALFETLQSGASTAELQQPVSASHAAIAVGNGTDALVLALRLFDIGPGDVVISPSHTAGATVSAIVQTGAKALLVDVDASMTIDPDKVAQAIAETKAPQRLRAVLAVHLYGQAANMQMLSDVAKAHGLVLIEDCAQALGATFEGRPLGLCGDAAAFSFYPTKNLGAFGDAGCVLVPQRHAERARALRQFGWQQPQDSLEPGINSRMDALQAALLRVSLGSFIAEQSARRERVAAYNHALRTRALPGLSLPSLARMHEHAWHQYVVRLERRDHVMRTLRERGIPVQIHYPKAVHQQAGFQAHCLMSSAGLGQSEQLVQQILSLPLHAHLPLFAIDAVADALAHALAP
jgi:dTDP-4-amino-4,6-dideoxygalactose transaminase